MKTEHFKKIEEFLKKDGEWHRPTEIRDKLKIDYVTVGSVLGFLVGYGVVESKRQEGGKGRGKVKFYYRWIK